MMFRVLSILAAVTSVVVLCCATTQAAVPQTINYQGYLTSPSGAPVNTTLQMVFSLYPAATGSTAVHTETQNVVLSNGIYNVVLGAATALTAPFDAPYWLGVQVGADAEMTPRQPLTSSPYAITAQKIAPGGNIVLTNPSTATAGNIMKGGGSFIHNFGPSNVFVGELAGNFTMSGSFNSVLGANALQNNTFGFDNSAIGKQALQSNLSGYRNTALGAYALVAHTSGFENTAVGHSALASVTTFCCNTAVGVNALLNSNGSENIAIGRGAGALLVTGNRNILIGHPGVSTEDGTIRIGDPVLQGNTLITGITSVGATTQLSFPSRLHVATLADKLAAVSTRGLAVTTGESASPFALDIKIIGAAALADRGVILQTTDWNTTDGGNLLLQPQGGKVGIGTTNPTKALVEINGFANYTLPGTVGLFSPSGAGSQIPQQALSYSLYASLLVAANSYVAFSDSRIKRVTGRSDTAKDLTTLAAIEITDYTYIDSVNQGNRPHKKVIAQQVEKIYPQAVNQTTDVVPDIYLKADIKDGWVKLAASLKKGEQVRLIGKTANGVYEVLDVVANRFRTDFKADADTVFVYGREVKDFRSVDYEAIAMLNVSATQELNRRVEAQAGEIALLKTQLAQLAHLQQQVAELARIQQQSPPMSTWLGYRE